ncbi:MAG: transaldolase [Gammaproteobacteria bacterium]|nr:transaldolase [Gammaproteobacteria bacterium]
MKNIQRLQELGQSLWLDHLSRELLTSGRLSLYIDTLGITGLTSNPTIYERALKQGDAYTKAIAKKNRAGKSGEALLFELALEDANHAADLFRPIHEATDGVEGWVSLEISPLLADDTTGTIAAAARLYEQAQFPNLLVNIPANGAGLLAIEALIFSGVPVNATLLFSSWHYAHAAEAYMRGIERRIEAGLDANVASVASVFISRWDAAVMNVVPSGLKNRLGIAVAATTYKVYREILASKRWQKLAAAGARPQRLLWASAGNKDPDASDVLYIEALAAPQTIITLPEKTLLAFASHGKVGTPLPPTGNDAEALLAEFAISDIDDAELAERLQREGIDAFAQSWRNLLTELEKQG